MANYLVTLNEPGKYNVGVDYEIPSKSIQYGNIIVGKTPVQDGTETTFSLTDQELHIIQTIINNLLLPKMAFS